MRLWDWWRSPSSNHCLGQWNGAAAGGHGIEEHVGADLQVGPGKIERDMAQTEDRRRISARLTVLQVGVVLLFAALAISFWFLQIVQHSRFEEMAANNHQRTL